MAEVASVQTLRTPDKGILQRLPFVFEPSVRIASLHFLRVAIVDCDWKKADAAFGKQLHAVKAMSDLVSIVLCEQVVALHSGLGLPSVRGDSFGDGEEALTVLAVAAIEFKSLVHCLLFPFHFHRYAFFIELVLAYSRIHAHQ